MKYVDPDGREDDINLLNEFFEIFDDVKIGIQDTISYNIPNVIKLEAEFNVVSVSKGNLTSGANLKMTLGNEILPIGNIALGREKKLEEGTWCCAFDLLSIDYEPVAEINLNTDLTVTLPIPFVSVDLNITEAVDFLIKTKDKIYDFFIDEESVK